MPREGFSRKPEQHLPVLEVTYLVSQERQSRKKLPGTIQCDL